MSHACFIAVPRFCTGLIPASGALLAAICLSQSVHAGDKVDQILAVDPTGTVRIHNPRGEIEVHGWDRPEVQVEGELDDLAKSLTFEVDGDETLIQIGLPHRNVNWGDGSDVEVYVPATSGLKIDGVSADIEVEGVTGPVAIRTVNGDVTLEGIGSRTHINTVSGDVEVSEGRGSLKVVTTSGNLKAELDATDIWVDTMSGDVDLQLGEFESLTMSSVSGTLAAEGGLQSTGRLVAKTVSGDIELRLFEPVNARINARTISGKIDNELTEDEPTKLRSNQQFLESMSGDGTAELRLRTISGSIELERTDTNP